MTIMIGVLLKGRDCLFLILTGHGVTAPDVWDGSDADAALAEGVAA